MGYVPDPMLSALNAYRKTKQVPHLALAEAGAAAIANKIPVVANASVRINGQPPASLMRPER